MEAMVEVGEGLFHLLDLPDFRLLSLFPFLWNLSRSEQGEEQEISCGLVAVTFLKARFLCPEPLVFSCPRDSVSCWQLLFSSALRLLAEIVDSALMDKATLLLLSCL
jgi:hypothetical protein